MASHPGGQRALHVPGDPRCPTCVAVGGHLPTVCRHHGVQHVMRDGESTWTWCDACDDTDADDAPDEPEASAATSTPRGDAPPGACGTYADLEALFRALDP